VTLKLAAGVLLSLAAASSSASACTISPGSAVYSPSFQQADPTWQVLFSNNTLTFSGGYAQLTPPKGDWAGAVYKGAFYDKGQACVAILNPPAVTVPLVGLIFGFSGSTSTFYALLIGANGEAVVVHYRNQIRLQAVPVKQIPTVNTAPNATNTLQVTWNGNNGTAYVNDTLFSNFVMPQPFQNTLIGFYGQGDASGTAGATWMYSNLQVTSVPP
jgi:hypothetical protein